MGLGFVPKQTAAIMATLRADAWLAWIGSESTLETADITAGKICSFSTWNVIDAIMNLTWSAVTAHHVASSSSADALDANKYLLRHMRICHGPRISDLLDGCPHVSLCRCIAS